MADPMIDLLLDWIPLWVWIVLAVAALFAAWNFLGTRGMLAVLAAIGTLGAYRLGRQTGREDEASKRRREQEKARQEREDMRAEGQAAEQVAKGMTDDEARKEAMKWSRKR